MKLDVIQRPVRLAAVLALTAAIGGCAGGSGPGGGAGPGTSPGGSAAPTALDVGSIASPGTAGGASTASASAVGAPSSSEADPCELVTRAEAEAQAGGAVTVESGALPGPPGEGMFCRYTSATLEELEIRTAVGRGDFDNDRKLATGNGWNVADVRGLGDEAWADKGPFLGSINLIARGAWVRVSASLGFGAKPMLALPRLAEQSIARLP